MPSALRLSSEHAVAVNDDVEVSAVVIIVVHAETHTPRPVRNSERPEASRGRRGGQDRARTLTISVVLAAGIVVDPGPIPRPELEDEVEVRVGIRRVGHFPLDREVRAMVEPEFSGRGIPGGCDRLTLEESEERLRLSRCICMDCQCTLRWAYLCVLQYAIRRSVHRSVAPCHVSLRLI